VKGRLLTAILTPITLVCIAYLIGVSGGAGLFVLLVFGTIAMIGYVYAIAGNKWISDATNTLFIVTGLLGFIGIIFVILTYLSAALVLGTVYDENDSLGFVGWALLIGPSCLVAMIFAAAIKGAVFFAQRA